MEAPVKWSVEGLRNVFFQKFVEHFAGFPSP